MSPRLAAVADAVADEIWSRKTLVFLPLCETSEAFAAALRARGIDARHVAGDSPDRAELLAWFATPGLKCLCNAMLLTEGYDEPSVDCLVMLRATQSGALYSQIELERRNIDEQREFYKDELAKAQTCADEMAALAWKWKYKADCQRATIRALVVAARAIHRTLWSALDQYDVNNEGIEREMRQHVIGLRWEMQQSERGQAGKE